MENAYSRANRELSELRRRNEDEQKRRESEVRLAAPEFAKVEAQLARCGAALARSVLSGNADISQIRKAVEEGQGKKAEILKGLKLPPDYLDDIYSCEKCRDTGFDENGRRCSCLKSLVSKYIGINSNLTEVMRAATFESFDFSLFSNQPDIDGKAVSTVVNNVYKKAKEFAETFDKTGANLYLYGPAGTGKTYISSCIANKALERGFTVCYQSAFRLLDTLEKLKFGRLDEESGSDAEYMSEYIYTVDLLIIDDVGTEFVSAYSSAALFDIINSRIISGKSTVVSSNLNSDKMEELYGRRMVSRMLGSFMPIRFIGTDLRRLKLKNRS